MYKTNIIILACRWFLLNTSPSRIMINRMINHMRNPTSNIVELAIFSVLVAYIYFRRFDGLLVWCDLYIYLRLASMYYFLMHALHI